MANAQPARERSGRREGPRERWTWLSRALLESRTILVGREITDRLAQDVVARLLLLEQQDPQGRITVFLNSPGGSADGGFAMYDVMKLVRCPIRTVAVGLCASAAVTVFMGGDRGERLALPHARFLLHQPSAGAYGQASDLEITAKEILRIRELYAEVIQEETGIPKDKILADANRDFWLSAPRAQEYGLVDRLVRTRDELP